MTSQVPNQNKQPRTRVNRRQHVKGTVAITANSPKKESRRQRRNRYRRERKQQYNSTQQNNQHRKDNGREKPLLNMPATVRKNQISNRADGDPRFSSNRSSLQFRSRTFYTQKGVQVNPTINNAALAASACAIVSKAITRGAYDFNNPNDPINAANFINSIFTNSANAAEPITQYVPGYIQTIKEFVSPKQIVYRKQQFNYAFQGVSTAPLTSAIPYGPPNLNANVNYGVIGNDGSGPEGLNLISPATVGSMTDQSASYNRVIQFLTKNVAKYALDLQQPLTKVELDAIKDSAAAYSCPTIVMGNAVANSGGDIVRLGNESPTAPDVMGVYATPATSFASSGRAPTCNSTHGGGAMETAFFTVQYKPTELCKVTRPVFKYININNLFYVYSKALALAIQLFLNDPDSLLLQNSASTGASQLLADLLPQCTQLQAALAFRSIIMQAASDVQWAVFGMSPTNSVEENFVGLACGVGTSPVFTNVSLYMSSYLQENIRSLLSRDTVTDEGGYRWFITVFGVYNDDSYSGNEFMINATTGGSAINVPLYQPSSGGKADKAKTKLDSPNLYKKDKKDKEPKVKVTPVKGVAYDINIWDGNSSAGYCEINSVPYLTPIIGKLNNSYKQVAKFVQATANFATSPVSDMLCQLGSTYYIVTNQNATSGGNYGSGYSVVNISYDHPPDQDIIEGFPMVPPTRLIGLTGISAAEEIATISATNLESYFIKSDHPYGNIAWNVYLDSVATMCVGDGKLMNSVKQINRLSAAGKGGIASTLLGILGPVAQTVAPMAAQAIDSLTGY